jgi:hypothetical protein
MTQTLDQQSRDSPAARALLFGCLAGILAVTGCGDDREVFDPDNAICPTEAVARENCLADAEDLPLCFPPETLEECVSAGTACREVRVQTSCPGHYSCVEECTPPE